MSEAPSYIPLKHPADLGEILPAVKSSYVEVSIARGAGVQLILVLGGQVGTIILRNANFKRSPSPATSLVRPAGPALAWRCSR